MRYAVSAILAATCLIAGCAKQPTADNAPVGAGPAANHNLVVQLQTKDGKSFSIQIPPPNGKPQDVKGLENLFEAFTDYCLEAFPDDAAVAAKARAAGNQPLNAEQVNHMLHGDPGQGWDVRIKDSVIAVTVEQPPFHSCGARVMVPTEPDIGMMTATFVGLWGFTQSPQETLVPGPQQSMNTGRVVQTLQPFVLIGPDKRPIEQIGAYIAHDPTSPQVELRLVRMRGNNPQ